MYMWWTCAACSLPGDVLLGIMNANNMWVRGAYLAAFNPFHFTAHERRFSIVYHPLATRLGRQRFDTTEVVAVID